MSVHFSPCNENEPAFKTSKLYSYLPQKQRHNLALRLWDWACFLFHNAVETEIIEAEADLILMQEPANIMNFLPTRGMGNISITVENLDFSIWVWLEEQWDADRQWTAKCGWVGHAHQHLG